MCLMRVVQIYNRMSVNLASRLWHCVYNIQSEPGVDMLHVAHCLPAHRAPVQPPGTLVAGHIVATRTKHARDELIHAHRTEALVLNLEQ